MKFLKILSILAVILVFSAPSAPMPSELNDKGFEAIKKGIDWLLKGQNRDGSWGIDPNQTPGDTTCTALAAMALMAQGNTERGGPAQEAVRKAFQYILKRARRARADISSDHPLIQGKLGQRVHTFFATVFLTQAYGMNTPGLSKEETEEIKEIVTRMADSISTTQESDGSWHKNTFGSLKSTAMAWLALRSCHSAGVRIRNATVDKTVQFIRNQYNSSTGLYDRAAGGGYGGYQTLYSTASSLRVLYGMGYGDTDEVKKAGEAFFKYVKSNTGGINFLGYEGEDFMAATLVTQAFMIENGEMWRKWFPFIQDALIKKQNKDGSWTGTACISGRTFATASSLLTLQSPYRLLPLNEQ